MVYSHRQTNNIEIVASTKDTSFLNGKKSKISLKTKVPTGFRRYSEAVIRTKCRRESRHS